MTKYQVGDKVYLHTVAISSGSEDADFRRVEVTDPGEYEVTHVDDPVTDDFPYIVGGYWVGDEDLEDLR